MSEDKLNNDGWFGYAVGIGTGVAVVALTTDITAKLNTIMEAVKIGKHETIDDCPFQDELDNIHLVLEEHTKGLVVTSSALHSLAGRVEVNSNDVTGLSGTLSDYFTRKTEPTLATVFDPTEGVMLDAVVNNLGEGEFEAVCPSLEMHAHGFTQGEALAHLSQNVLDARKPKKALPKGNKS